VHTLLPLLLKGELPKVMVGDLDQNISLPKSLLTHFEAQTRAFVQIQQGCDQGCTFCIIHVARGPSRSLPTTLIKRQVQKLIVSGYAEIVVCGVDLGSYGEDFSDLGQAFDLVDLLKELLQLECEADNPFRIRLSSIDPVHLSDELIELMASNDRMVPHIHLSLQSGNTLILKRMKRRYGADLVRERITRLRQRVPQLVMSADVMVGFPTETDEQFEDTWSLLEELEIAFPHVFSYSERAGTPAARIPSKKQVPVPERKVRNKKIRDRALLLQQQVMRSRVGQVAWVLPENRLIEGQYRFARAEDYLAVMVPADHAVQGRWLRVRYTGLKDTQLLAEPL
jgi:threonylcarbamoyladenosine tRNA methylthiotransferase MtaB